MASDCPRIGLGRIARPEYLDDGLRIVGDAATIASISEVAPPPNLHISVAYDDDGRRANRRETPTAPLIRIREQRQTVAAGDPAPIRSRTEWSLSEAT